MDLPAPVRRLLWRVVNTSRAQAILISVSALVVSVLVSVLVLIGSGLLATCREPWLVLAENRFCYDPMLTLSKLFVEPVLNGNGLALTLRETSVLVFTALAVAITFRAGLFNIGVQGQMIFGSLGATLVLLAVAPALPGGPLGAALLLPFGLLVGAVIGGLWGALPGVLKAYGDANEVITTIMLNFIAANVAFVLVTGYFQNPASNITETMPLPAEATVQPLLVAARSNFSVLALLVGVAFVVGVAALLRYTRLGYSFRISGLQPGAAEYGGIDAKSTIMYSMTLSGALGGVGGAIWAMMIYGGWTPGIPAYGFDGITVSILAGNNPLGVVPAAVLFGVLKSGSVSIDFATSVPRELVAVLRGLIILFVAMPGFFRVLGRRVVDLDPPATASEEGPTNG